MPRFMLPGRHPPILWNVLVVTLAACGAENPAPAPAKPVDLVEIRPLAPELFVGQRLLLEALPTDGNGEDLGYRPTVWSSSDASVATVTNGGLVEGMQPGEARIAATIEGVEGSVLVVVTPTPLGRVAVEPSSLELVVGESELLEAKAFDVLGGEIEAAAFGWSSSDDTIVEVDGEGRIRGLRPGEATVVASLEGVEGSASVRVVEARIDHLVYEKDVSIYTGQQRALQVDVVHTNGVVRTDAKLSWRSTVPSVATVDAEGLIRAWAPGKTTIVASLVDLEAWIHVTVVKMPVTRVEVEPENVTAYAGEQVDLAAFAFGLAPEPIGGERIAWSSSDTKLATVNEKGVVRLLGRGEVAISATAGGVSGSSTITIRRSPAIGRIEPLFPVHVGRGDQVQLEARVFDVEGLQVVGLPLEWSSADPSIASIDRGGRLQAHEIGAVDVTVSVDGVSAGAVIHIIRPFAVGEVEIVGDDSELLLGERRRLRAEVVDDEGRPVDFLVVNWSSSDESIATVNFGEVTAFAAGDVTIYAEALGVAGSIELEVISVEFSQIRAGRLQICGLTVVGELYCWGQATRMGVPRTPGKIFGEGRFRHLAVGDSHVCVIDDESKAFCGGDNTGGQLGDGTEVSSWNALVPVAGGHEFRSIEVGGGMSCGVTIEGKGYCWGWGLASQEPRLVFDALVPALVAEELRFSSITPSSYVNLSDFMISCGLSTDHRAYCWGANSTGELGNGTVTPSLSPTPVGGGLLFSSVSATTRIAGRTWTPAELSHGHGCGITMDKDAYCWGSNLFGQLGIGTKSISELLPKKVTGGHAFKEIHTQSYPTSFGPPASDGLTCGLDVDGRALCWGLSDTLLPSPVGESQRAPIPVGGDMRFESLSLGLGLLCGMAVNGKAYCWGFNNAGVSIQGILGVFSQDDVVQSPTLVLGQLLDPPQAPPEEER